MPGEETEPLTGEKIQYMGNQMLCDDNGWHWVMVFPALTEGNKDSWDKKIDSGLLASAKSMARKIFTKRSWEELGVEKVFNDGMTKRDFHTKVREKLLEIFTSKQCGFTLGTMETVDKDEMFLLIALDNPKAQEEIANRQEIRIPVTRQAYTEKQLECPTDTYSAGAFKEGDDVPLYLSYSNAAHLKSKFNKFTELELIRMVRARIRDFVQLENLQNSGVVLNMFPVHKWNDLKEMDDQGWSNVKACCQCPNKKQDNLVRAYFGEEVGFFFHWLNHYTSSLLVPALLGFVLFFRRYVFEKHMQRTIQIGFATFMCLWSAYFTSSYKRKANLNIVKWGMKNYDQVATVRRNYDESKRGTCGDITQRAFHWVLAVIFMAETVGAVFVISKFQSAALRAHEAGSEELVYGFPPGVAGKLAKYLITINIKVVDQMWKRLSPCLTACENWKTSQQYKSAKVRKLFCVKFIVYYYPFFYIAFMKEHIEGCPSKVDGCHAELKQNLAVFFFTHVATVIAMIILPTVLTRISIRMEISAAEKKGHAGTYSYLQAQAKCPEYPDDTDDFMELILSLGFVMMFAVELPVMAFLALLANMIEIRLLAFKMSYVFQRTDPTGQEGIGAWAGIIETVSVVAVVVNVGIAIFCMHPLRDLSLKVQLGIFVIAENAMLLIQKVLRAAIDDKTLTQVVIEEKNSDAMDDIMGESDKPVNAPPTTKPEKGLPIDPMSAAG